MENKVFLTHFCSSNNDFAFYATDFFEERNVEYKWIDNKLYAAIFDGLFYRIRQTQTGWHFLAPYCTGIYAALDEYLPNADVKDEKVYVYTLDFDDVDSVLIKDESDFEDDLISDGVFCYTDGFYWWVGPTFEARLFNKMCELINVKSECFEVIDVVKGVVF